MNTHSIEEHVHMHTPTHMPPHSLTGEAQRMGQVLAISPHINHPPLNNLSVVLTV